MVMADFNEITEAQRGRGIWREGLIWYDKARFELEL
jgi:hypothetical protein